MRPNHLFRISAISLLLLSGAISCRRGGGTETFSPPGPNPTVQPVTNEKAVSGPANRLPASSAKIGIAECDMYLEKSERCISNKVPEGNRPQMVAGLAATRREWQKLAASPADKERLTIACKLALENGRKAMTAFHCEWD